MAKNRILDDGVTKSYLKRKRIEKLLKVATPLAAVVVFCVTYWLILPATAMQKQLICEKEEHVHTEDCYEEQVLVCGLEEHIHDDSCYDAAAKEESLYLCGHDYEHIHGEACYYEDGSLKCTLLEHTHTEECLKEAGEEVSFSGKIAVATASEPDEPKEPLDALVEDDGAHEDNTQDLICVTYEDDGDAYLLTASATDDNNAVYAWQWQYSESGADPWINIEGATDQTLSISKDSDLAVSFIRVAGTRKDAAGLLMAARKSTASEYIPAPKTETETDEAFISDIEEVTEEIPEEETNEPETEDEAAAEAEEIPETEDAVVAAEAVGMLTMASPVETAEETAVEEVRMLTAASPVEMVEEVTVDEAGADTFFEKSVVLVESGFSIDDPDVEEISADFIEDVAVYDGFTEPEEPADRSLPGTVFSNAVFLLGASPANEKPVKPADPVDAAVSPVKHTEADSAMKNADNKKIVYYADSDKSTSDIEKLLQGINGDDGRIATDKSVVYGTNDYYDFGSYAEDEFSVTLSALGQQYLETSTVKKTTPIDVVLVLDVSGSMTNKDIPGGQKRFEVVTDAANVLISRMMKLNPSNRIGVSVFSGTADVDDNDNYVGFLPLSRYTVDGSYELGTEFLKKGNNKISTNADLKDVNGTKVKNAVSVTGGTYTQAGIYNSYEVLDESFDGRNEKATPVVILISDGVPTYDSQSYTDPTLSTRKCDGRERENALNARHGYYTVLTANHVKNMINKLYYGSDTGKYRATFYTVGMGVSPTDNDDIYMRAVLNPDGDNVGKLGTSAGNKGKREIALRNYLSDGDSEGVHPNPLAGNYSYANDAFFREDYDAGIMADLLINVILQNMGAYEYSSSLGVSSTRTEGSITVRDTIGDGMQLTSVPVLHYTESNGTVHNISPNETSGNTYTYTGTVTTKQGVSINLQGGEICIDEYGDGYALTGTSGAKHVGSGQIDGKDYYYDESIKKFYFTDSNGSNYIDYPDRKYYYDPGRGIYFKEGTADIIYRNAEGFVYYLGNDGIIYYTNAAGLKVTVRQSDSIYHVDGTDHSIYYTDNVGVKCYDVAELGTIYTVHDSVRWYNEKEAIRFTYYQYDPVKAQVTTDTSGNQAVTWTIPGMILPEYARASYLQASGDQSSRKYLDWYYKQLPIRLIYKVGLTEASKNKIKALTDANNSIEFYTNEFKGTKDACAQFTVGKNNLYFDEAGNSSLSKSKNATETRENYLEETITKGTDSNAVIDVFGNNGKLRYVLNPPINLGSVLPVEKVWDDDVTAADRAAYSVEIQLYKANEKSGKPVMLNSEKNWKHEFSIPAEDVAKKVNYTVKEVGVFKNGVSIEDDYEEPEITTKKFTVQNPDTWELATYDNLKNDDIVRLVRAGQNNSGYWAYRNKESSNDLDVTEFNGEDRQLWVVTKGTNVIKLRSKVNNEYLGVNDSGNQAKTKEKEQPELKIRSDSTLRLNNKSKTRYQINGSQKPVYVSTEAQGYNSSYNVIVQKLVSGTSGTYEGYVIKNTKKSSITIPVTKTWSSTAEEKKVPVTATLYKKAKVSEGTYEYQQVMKEGVPYTVTLDSGHSWKAQFENLPVLGTGEQYLVSEENVNGFITSYAGTTETFTIGTGKEAKTVTAGVVTFGTGKTTVSNDLAITNTPYTCKITVKKIYEPSGCTTPVDVVLYKTVTNGSDKELVAVDETVNLNTSNSWTHTFTDLPVLPEGDIYCVRESTVVDGYAVSYFTRYTDKNTNTPAALNSYIHVITGDETEQLQAAEVNFENGSREASLIVVNRQDPVEIKVVKEWPGTSSHPESITIDVYKVDKTSKSGVPAIATGGTVLTGITIDASTSWEKKFTVNKPGDNEAYAIVEHTMDGYITTYSNGTKQIFIGEGADRTTVPACFVTFDDETGKPIDVTVTNTPGSELPMTGGIGTAPIYALGALLMCGLLFLL